LILQGNERIKKWNDFFWRWRGGKFRLEIKETCPERTPRFHSRGDHIY